MKLTASIHRMWKSTLRLMGKQKRVLLIGGGPLARKIVRIIQKRSPHQLAGMVLVPDGAGPQHTHGNALEQLLEKSRADWIILAPADRRGRLPVHQLLRFRVRGIRIEEGVNAYERLSGKLAIEFLRPSSLLFGDGFPRAGVHAVVSRAMSIAAGSTILLIFTPLMAAIALAIRLESRGPILFVQKRIGQHGKTFNLVKFRTMTLTSQPTSLWEKDNNHRVTRVGRLLRKLRLDELPQCIALIRGEMNLVGPRPHPVDNYDLFKRAIPYYWLRTLVPPGMTGWAQIKYGYANGLAEETEKVRYDLYYIKHRSVWLDLRILPSTLKTLLSESREDDTDGGRPEVLVADALEHPTAAFGLVANRSGDHIGVVAPSERDLGPHVCRRLDPRSPSFQGPPCDNGDL